jgi:hypothetical protein
MPITLRSGPEQRQYWSLKDPGHWPGGESRSSAGLAAATTAPHAGALDARPDGTRKNRTSAAVSGCCDRSTGSSQAGRSKILEKPWSPDSPRARFRRRKRHSAVVPRVRGSGATARGGGSDPDHWRDSADWPATATTGGLHGDRRRCSNAPADAAVGTAAHTPSTNNDALGNVLGLAWAMSQGTLKVGPREVLLPQVKSRREAPTSRRGDLVRYNPLLAVRGWTKVGYRCAGARTTGGPPFTAIGPSRLWPA